MARVLPYLGHGGAHRGTDDLMQRPVPAIYVPTSTCRAARNFDGLNRASSPGQAQDGTRRWLCSVTQGSASVGACRNNPVPSWATSRWVGRLDATAVGAFALAGPDGTPAWRMDGYQLHVCRAVGPFNPGLPSLEIKGTGDSTTT